MTDLQTSIKAELDTESQAILTLSVLHASCLSTWIGSRLWDKINTIL
jgi:hypothetical protein